MFDNFSSKHYIFALAQRSTSAFYGRQKAVCTHFLVNIIHLTFFCCWLELNSSAFCWLQISCDQISLTNNFGWFVSFKLLETYLLLRYGLSAQFLRTWFYKKHDTINFQSKLFFCGSVQMFNGITNLLFILWQKKALLDYLENWISISNKLNKKPFSKTHRFKELIMRSHRKFDLKKVIWLFIFCQKLNIENMIKSAYNKVNLSFLLVTEFNAFFTLSEEVFWLIYLEIFLLISHLLPLNSSKLLKRFCV